MRKIIFDKKKKNISVIHDKKNHIKFKIFVPQYNYISTDVYRWYSYINTFFNSNN